MKKLAIAAVTSGALIALASLNSYAAQPVAPGVSPAPIAGVSVLQAEGIVQAVDRVAHTVTVKDAASGQATFNVSPDSTKLAELKQGDKVRIRMVRDAVISPSGSSSNNARSAGAATANAGKDDQAAQNTIAAEIVTVDRTTGVVALKGAKGDRFHVQISDAVQSAHLVAGMHVQVVYAASATVSVSAASGVAAP
jgi:Cu/Ag efflux protein CusF